MQWAYTQQELLSILWESMHLPMRDHAKNTKYAALFLSWIVRFREVQIIVKGKEETVLAVYWVTDGVNCCRVGFLPRHMVKYKEAYDG